jgi:hypothetical protein
MNACWCARGEEKCTSPGASARGLGELEAGHIAVIACRLDFG